MHSLSLVQKRKFLEIMQTRPSVFMQKVMGIESIEGYQHLIFDTIANNERTAISACHNVGKSWGLARIVLWFTSVFPNSKVITTAPTYNQVKNILWSEIRTAYAKSKTPLGGTMLTTEWQVSNTGDWFAMGFTAKADGSADPSGGQGTQSSFQGFHAEHLLVVFDEATGVHPAIWTMAEGLLTSGHVKFVCIANPTSTTSDFFKCFSDPAWAKVKISCFDSPNLKANGITCLATLKAELNYLKDLPEHARLQRLAEYKITKSYMLSARWVMSKALSWGIDHPLFVSKVLGEFPENSEDVIATLQIVEEAQRRTFISTEEDKRSLGVDVARHGTDSTVFTYLHGMKHVGTKRLTKKDTSEVAGAVVAYCRELGWPDSILIDSTGVGAGVFDKLNELKNDPDFDWPDHCQLVEVHFGASCKDENDDEKDKELKERYVNMKAAMYDKLSTDLKEGLTLLDEEIYLEELPTIKYFYDSRGRVKIESKDEYKKRTGRSSPDHADSLALANWGNHISVSSAEFTSIFSNAGGSTLAGSLRG